ncbi:MAG: hypothetical protein ACYTG6_04895 [Planctomycetota bacterium]|jgi:hypothetical protein
MDRRSFAAGLAVLLLLATPSAAEDPVPTREQIEQDLVLRIRYRGPPTVQPGEEIPITWSLTNRSETRTHRYVLPSDGSESAWREPYVYYTGERPGADGAWEAVQPPGTGGRCGLFDANWHDEIRSIAPGETVELDTWLPLPVYAIDTQRAGRVRLRANYAYRAIEPEREVLESETPPRGHGEMGTIPPFHLVSNAVEFEIVRRLEIEASALAEIQPGVEHRLSELLALRVVNVTDEPILLDPRRWDFEMGNTSGARVERIGSVQPTAERLRAAAPRRLDPGESVPLVGADALRPDRDLRLRFEGEPGASVWATFVLIAGQGSRVRLLSPYCELKLAR